MNTHPRAPDLAPAPSGNGDGLPRRRWSLSEVEQAVAAGIIPEDERIELIDGDLVAMSPKGRRHEIIRVALVNRWIKLNSADIMLAPETPLRLELDVAPEPDIFLFPASILVPDVRGNTVLLVVEISDSSYSYDLKIKAPLYARFGVREYWVIDANTLTTTIHRGPSATGYTDVREQGPDDRIEPIAAPTLRLRLADLKI